MSEVRPPRPRWLRLLRWLLVRPWFRIAAWVVGLAVASLATLVLVSAFASRKLPDLRSWHRDAPEGEFRARHLKRRTTLEDYLAREANVFSQLDALYAMPEEAEEVTTWCRFVKGGPGDPATFPENWNRTQVLWPEGEAVAGVLLLHGLTDGPYSMRHIARIFADRGYYVLCMRLPGHGTVPKALDRIRWQDWQAAARLGARHVCEQIGPERPFLVGGYSTGGALAVGLALDAIEDGRGRCPDHLYLFSASIGVTAFAMLSLVDRSLAWIPYFEKSAWLSVVPEFDPFKYNSFPKRAGFEVWQLTRHNTSRLTRLAARGEAQEFPPTLVFHSAADATVLNSAVRTFIQRMPDNGSELVVFDVLNGPGMREFLRRRPRLLTELVAEDRPFGVSVVTNPVYGSRDVVVRRRAPGASEVEVIDIPIDWPWGVFSLSHIAIPFPAADPIYGDGSGAIEGRLAIGAAVLRGERGVFTIPAGDLIRMRHNPFFEYVEERIVCTFDQLPGPPAAGPANGGTD